LSGAELHDDLSGINEHDESEQAIREPARDLHFSMAIRPGVELCLRPKLLY
jgi:hypothetical protein